MFGRLRRRRDQKESKQYHMDEARNEWDLELAELARYDQ